MKTRTLLFTATLLALCAGGAAAGNLELPANDYPTNARADYDNFVGHLLSQMSDDKLEQVNDCGLFLVGMSKVFKIRLEHEEHRLDAIEHGMHHETGKQPSAERPDESERYAEHRNDGDNSQVIIVLVEVDGREQHRDHYYCTNQTESAFQR